MAQIHVDGPDGPEEVHLLREADEVEPHVGDERKADKREYRWIAGIVLAALVLAIIGMVQEKTLLAGLATLGIVVLLLGAVWGRGR